MIEDSQCGESIGYFSSPHSFLTHKNESGQRGQRDPREDNQSEELYRMWNFIKSHYKTCLNEDNICIRNISSFLRQEEAFAKWLD